MASSPERSSTPPSHQEPLKRLESREIRRRRLRLRVLVALFGALVVLGALTAYLLVSAGGDIRAARAILSSPGRSLSLDEIERANRRLRDAHDELNAPAAKLLGAVPVARQNVGALRAVVGTSIPVLDAATDLRKAVDEIEDGELISDGRVDVDALSELELPLDRQAEKLRALEKQLKEQRSGWLLPAVWDAFANLLDETTEVRRGAELGARGAAMVGGLLGTEGPRRYLVLLMNNAELRGAGGIPSGVGTVRLDDGKLELGGFQYYAELARPPYRRVPAPTDFERRYGRYGADTTSWVQTTFSPDASEVALVAARLFRVVKGIETDGVVLADPRGIAALMPAGTKIRVPGTRTRIKRRDVPSYVYSRAYEELGGRSPKRREALLTVGETAISSMLDEGVAGAQVLGAVGDAIAGGHLRLVSLHEEEQSLLSELGVSGDLTPPEHDAVLVTGQNFGGDKLDFWARRAVRHYCSVKERAVARCATQAVVANRAPPGLPRYVAPNGRQLKSLIEVYIPGEAGFVDVRSTRESAEFRRDEHAGYTTVAALLEIPPGEVESVVVVYDLPVKNDRYSLEIIPQPLAHDAQLEVGLRLPSSWRLETDIGSMSQGVVRYSGTLDSVLRLEASEREERSGIPALWDGFSRFWREPLFRILASGPAL